MSKNLQNTVKTLHAKLESKIAVELNYATSKSGAKALSDDMDDIKSRHECETIILDRKIASLQGLREKWRLTEAQLRELSSSLQQYEARDCLFLTLTGDLMKNGYPSELNLGK